MPSDHVSSIAPERRLVRAHGRVQGVGYRDACAHQARALGVAGWVRNRGDGTVEALLQGTLPQLDAMCDWMRSGPPSARVERLDISPAGALETGLSGFGQRATV